MTKPALRLTGNQLKLIAMLAMTADHVGLQLLPQWGFLRFLGRLAMPLYAYMIAEGCRYTRNRARYFGSVALMGLGCQIVYFFFMGSLYQCILVTFSLSIALIFLLDRVNGPMKFPAVMLGITTVYFLTAVLPALLPATDFRIDYDFWGVMLPVLIYLGKDRPKALLMSAIGVALLGAHFGGDQWYGLLTVPLLALYDGTRGKANIKTLFYLYYPAHLAVIYLLSLIL
jgi:hypothetical protein